MVFMDAYIRSQCIYTYKNLKQHMHRILLVIITIDLNGSTYLAVQPIQINTMYYIFHGPGPVFCLLLGVSSGITRPIRGQVTSVTWPVIGWAWYELTPSKTKKLGPGFPHWNMLGPIWCWQLVTSSGRGDTLSWYYTTLNKKLTTYIPPQAFKRPLSQT